MPSRKHSGGSGGLGIKRYQRTGEKEQQIRSCAAAIMTAFNAGEETPHPKGFTPAVRRSAYRLLLFEGIITRASGFKLSVGGKQHIERHGPVVYPNAYKKPNGSAV